MNIISKLIQKTKGANYTLSQEAQQNYNTVTATRTPKLAKLLAALAIASILALTPLALSACSPRTDAQNPTPGVVDPEHPNNTKKYSQILQTVLTDPTYKQMATSMLGVVDYVNKYRGFPFTFLARQGHDVAALKKDELNSTLYHYTLDNNSSTLYYNVSVENKSSTSNYYTQYILSYNLTEQELEDFTMLYSGNYVQERLFLQELDKQKTANVISCVNIEKTSYEKLQTAISKDEDIKKIFDSNPPNRMIITKVEDVYSNILHNIDVQLAHVSESNENLYKGKVGVLNIQFDGTAGTSITDGVFKVNYPQRAFVQNLEEFSNNLQTMNTYLLSSYFKSLTK